MSSGLDWERFGVITGGDEVCILPPPTLSEKGVGIPTLSISLNNSPLVVQYCTTNNNVLLLYSNNNSPFLL